MTDFLWPAFDLILAALLLVLGWAAVTSPNMKRAVALFIAFGLLMALAWARLKAPDLALAEAAIGAGMTGALLLVALRDRPTAVTDASRQPRALSWSIDVLAVALAAILVWALAYGTSRPSEIQLVDSVSARLLESGVVNPVTAVLLNFRAYDTLLELAVLLTAALGIVALGNERQVFRPAGPILRSLVNWLVPILIVTGAYLL